MAQPCVAPTSPRSPGQHSAVWICTSPAGGGKAPRAAARPSAVRTGLLHCPGAGPPAVTPAQEEGCVRPSPSSSDLPHLGTRPDPCKGEQRGWSKECSRRGQLHRDPNTTQQAPPNSQSRSQASPHTKPVLPTDATRNHREGRNVPRKSWPPAGQGPVWALLQWTLLPSSPCSTRLNDGLSVIHKCCYPHAP